MCFFATDTCIPVSFATSLSRALITHTTLFSRSTRSFSFLHLALKRKLHTILLIQMRENSNSLSMRLCMSLCVWVNMLFLLQLMCLAHSDLRTQYAHKDTYTSSVFVWKSHSPIRTNSHTVARQCKLCDGFRNRSKNCFKMVFAWQKQAISEKNHITYT